MNLTAFLKQLCTESIDVVYHSNTPDISHVLLSDGRISFLLNTNWVWAYGFSGKNFIRDLITTSAVELLPSGFGNHVQREQD